jgi:uncharacterized RDD family membrane protein YckC
LAAPDKLIIDTPEQIALEYTLAGPGSRFLALAVDTVLQVLALLTLVLLLVAARVISGTGIAAWATWVQAAVVIASFLLMYGYFALFEALWNGQTPGKRLIGVRVITVSGRPITALDAILRNLLRIVDSIPGIYAIGLVAMFVTSRHQRLGDLVAGTVVVQEQPLERRSAPVLSAAPAPVGAARLEPREIEAMERFLSRRDDLPDYLRERTARQLAWHVRARLSLSPEQQPSHELLLEELVAEYRRAGRTR